MTKLTNVLKLISLFLLIAVGLLGFMAYKVSLSEEPMITLGGTSPYNHTTTIPTGDASQLLKTQFGTLGRITVTTAGAGSASLYDATTTIATERATAATTSLPLIAEIGAGLAAGTYEFDTAFNDGLLVVFYGAIGTSTIMWD